jgi:hypothetical protein
MPEIHMFRVVLSALWGRFQALREEERGSATLEQILMAVALASAAVVAGGFILARVNSTAQSIPTGTP